MIDTVQAVLLFVIVLLTVLLLVLGVQVYSLLKELRTTILRANKVLENTETITGSVSEPMSLLSTFLLGTRSIAKILKNSKRDE